VKEQSDEELYRQMQKGDRQAFAELYERYEPALYRYAMHMSGNRFIGEEVAHEVFMQLMASTRGFEPERGRLEPYLYGIARNLIRMVRRKARAEPLEEQIGRHDILGDLILTESISTLYRSLQELPDRYRDAVVLCDLEERSYEDAARLMECPVGTVRSRLHRARLLLGAKLKPIVASNEVAS
jgi:RNA polymerase sigma-70 factor (ECF subfamily)